MPLEVKNLDIVIKVAEAKFKEAEARFERAVDDEVTRMVARTRAGKDINGQAFAPYSKGYAKAREKRGRKASPVDLTFSGKMLSAVTTKTERTSEKTSVTVFFNSVKEALKARGNQAKRFFFGFSEEQKERIRKKIVGS
jgi:3-hydroxyacyl-CoA dehydrogenase